MIRERYMREIGRAKARGWREMLEKLNEDPWGRPYKVVRRKLKTSGGGPIKKK